MVIILLMCTLFPGEMLPDVQPWVVALHVSAGGGRGREPWLQRHGSACVQSMPFHRASP